ncbi:uncharacterized protein LOC110619953 [Manihot esculenta]|uniref:Uncharacterized protein n=1 Tax=Manihot esculenta TaxID=3983 RepID=A0A2C9VF67_MANES|nr:uncharacterized protein LOC110619953 [Manihot esculenta]OAY43247.1 hypothetical protein MANES_08G054000v8 [Manihot esculenta]
MSNRRRHKGEIHFQEVHGTTRSNHKKPPQGSWQPTVPSWEKRFCYSVGLVPWRKLLETKKSMYLYENVVKWNDSAGEEAFHNAKNRFWAKINGLPCDISLPDPDIYIDEIDWNSNIDPELYLDLEREPKYPHNKENGEEVVIFGSCLLPNQSFSCTGWGEAEEDFQQKAAPAVLDPLYEDCDQKANNGNPWKGNVSQSNVAAIDNEWENCWNGSHGCKNNYDDWNNKYNQGSNYNDTTGGELETWNGNMRKKEGAGWYMSRYKTSRFQRNDYQMDREWWRNGKGRKRMNFVY